MKYQNKREEVEAIQWTNENTDAVKAFLEKHLLKGLWHLHGDVFYFVYGRNAFCWDWIVIGKKEKAAGTVCVLREYQFDEMFEPAASGKEDVG